MTPSIIRCLEAMWTRVLSSRFFSSLSFLLPARFFLSAHLAVTLKVRDFSLLRQMRSQEGEGKAKRGRTVTGMTEEDGRCRGRGETSVLKTWLHLAWRNAAGGIYWEKSHWMWPWAAAAQGWLNMLLQLVCLCEQEGETAIHTGALEEEEGGSFYHACLVFRSSSHGLTERQALKAVHWGRSVGVMFQLSFVAEQGEGQWDRENFFMCFF